MTRSFSLVFILFIILSTGFCYERKDLAVDLIDPLLNKNAKAVVRYSNWTINIKSINKAEIDYEYAITILNENGDDNAVFSEVYGKFSKIKNIEIHILDKNGKELRKVKSIEILDHSAISGFSAYEDNRVKYFKPEVTQYPYTVEIKYTEIKNEILFLPIWNPISDHNVSVQKSNLKLICPKSVNIRYKENLVLGTIQNLPDETIYSWEVNNIAALEKEFYSRNIREYMPLVYLSPDDFQMDDYPGNCNSWQNLGKWINTLNYKRDSLDEKTRLEVSNLIQSSSDDYSKIKVLYEYMQNYTRYVNISIGIGGWQPIEAQNVHRLGYGDCKALSNYMFSLLKVAGIQAHYTLISAGAFSPDIRNDFPSSQFNHVILCVPLQNDTLWLECTSQVMPCFYQGSFTDDREALVITEKGGKLVHTAIYDETKNMKNRLAQFTIDTNGNASISSTTVYHCFFYDQIEYLMRSDEADKRKLITEDIELPSFKLDNFKLKENKSRYPFIEEKLSITANNYGTKIKNRILIPLSLLSHDFTLPRKTKSRKCDVSIRRSYSCSDTIRYSIPENFSFETIPQPVALTSVFGTYQNRIEVDGNMLMFTRKLVMKKGKHPASSYNELYNFIEQIIEADNVKVSMKRKG